MTGDAAKTHDVVIIGTGWSGTLLAAILARQGVDVILLDKGTHPKFAVGESTIPHTSLLLSMLAARWDVPEIDHLAFPDRIQKHVCTTCGIKRSFGFAWHREGEEHDRRAALLFGTASKDENHLFRQDVDAYLFYTALRYGAKVREEVEIAGVTIDAGGVRVALRSGEEVRARYVADATGFRSVVADALDLREKPTSIRHQSRTLFTHMIDVKPFDETDTPFRQGWHTSTLHHVFDRGWFWVIPFDNQKGSTNPVVSVGLTVDPRSHPKPASSGAAEFGEFVRRFPSVIPQFENAKAVRPWVSTGRVQYSSKRTTGYRFTLMSHASGFVDPLYSRGLINTVEVITALVPRLLAALADDDFDLERFESIETLHRRMIRYNDRLVNGSFASWRDFDLWNAWVRVWAFGTIVTEFRVMRALSEYTATGDVSHLNGNLTDPAFSNLEDPDYHAFFRRAVELMDACEAGTVPAAETATRLFALQADYEFPILLNVPAMRRAGWLKEGEEISERSMRFAREGYRWALANPTSRDLFGTAETLYRWRAHRADPHLEAREPAK
ncbi:MAG: NAD(P)/FAD-dependent oxidoreductase [Candidatus Eiseniibacteriota bacterium]